MPRMTILINATSAKMGGALTYLENLTESLLTDPSDRTYHIFVADCLTSLPHALERVTIHRVSDAICNSPFRLFLWQQTHLRRELKKLKGDILYSTANFAMFFCPVPQILYVRIPHYYSPEYRKHILPIKSLKEKIDFIVRKHLIYLSAHFSRLVAFPSESTRNDFLKAHSFPKDKTSVNYHGTRPDRLPSSPKIDRQTKAPINILCTSNYSDYKNYTTLLKALLILQSKGVGFHFAAAIDLKKKLFANLPSARIDRELLTQLKADSVALFGVIPYKETLKLYETADIFVWPSLAETFGHPLIEAMAAGVPIVSSDIPVNREICGNAAIYFSPLNPRECAEKILELSHDEKLREMLIAEGKDRVKLFLWQDHFLRLNSMFGNLYDNRHHSNKK